MEAHASLYPEPRELFLPHAVDVRNDGGFGRDEQGHVTLHDEGLLVRWDDVDVVTFAYVDDVEPETR